MNPKTDKLRLLGRLQVDYEFVERTLSILTPEQMLIKNVQGHWSTKDTMAHLTAWLKRLIAWIERAQRGEEPHVPQEGYTWEDTDTINDLQYEADKDRSLNDVLADWRATYQQTYTLLESLSEDDLFDSTFNGLFSQPITALIIFNSYHHFGVHIEPLREWMLRLAE